MPRLRFTDRTIAALKPTPSKQVDYFDTSSATGLGLRISPAGRKAWFLLHRVDGRLQRLALRAGSASTYPEISLAAARDLARTAIQATDHGRDPRKERRQAAEQTIGVLGEKFVARAKERGRRSWAESQRMITKDLAPWRDRPVASIRRAEVRELVETVAQRAPVSANRLLSLIKSLMNMAVDLEWIPVSPVHRLEPPADEQTRDRVLTRDELRELWAALNETHRVDADGKPVPRLSSTLNVAFKTMLLTGQRSGEVARMAWADVDLEAGYWSLPPSLTKNKTHHRVPLSDTVLDLVAGQLQIAKPDAVYVFSSQVDRVRVNRSKPATARRTHIGARAKKAAAYLSKGLTFTFRAHDLRRTCASYMAEAGVPREHVAYVLNHRSVTGGLTSIYDRYDRDVEKRDALNVWARRLHSIIIEAPAGNVVAFRGRA